MRTLDVAQLVAEMRDRVQRAPKLFARAAVVLDFGGLTQTPDADTARALVDGLREAGVLPVALAYGTREIEALVARSSACRCWPSSAPQYERAGDAPAEPAPAPRRAREAGAAPKPPPRTGAGADRAAPRPA